MLWIAHERVPGDLSGPFHGRLTASASVCQRRLMPNVQTPPKASATPAAQLPYRSITVDGAGHSPARSRLSASPPRRRAWVRDQS